MLLAFCQMSFYAISAFSNVLAEIDLSSLPILQKRAKKAHNGECYFLNMLTVAFDKNQNAWDNGTDRQPVYEQEVEEPA
jgi:hypothetical protein